MTESVLIEPLVLTVTEAAMALRCSRAQAYRLVASGELPSVLVGTRRRVPRWALEQMVHAAPSPGSNR